MTPSPDTPDFDVIPDIHNSPTIVPDTPQELQRLQLGVQVAANETQEVITDTDIKIYKIILGDMTSTPSSFLELKNIYSKILNAPNRNKLESITRENIFISGFNITIEEVFERMDEVVNSRGNRVESSPLPEIEIQSQDSMRAEIKREMSKYPAWNRYVKKAGKSVNLYPKSIPNADANYYYYGITDGKPLDGMPINNVLYESVRKTDNSQEPTTYIRRIGDKTVLVTYIGGKLVFASYTAPGSFEDRSPENQVLIGDSSKKYYITGAPASSDFNRERNRWEGAPMAYSVEVNAETGIHVHAGQVGTDTRTGNRIQYASHGCFRLPLFYAKHFYELFNTKAGGKMKYVIENLY